jgi:hypothetical protein
MLSALWAVGSCVGAAAAAEVYSEEAVKAAFLYRFGNYVQWPAERLDAPNFTIAVMAADEVAAQLAQLLPGHSVRDRPAQVRSIRSIRELDGAQILYIGAGHRQELQAAIAAVRDQPVLVVTDDANGLDAGAAINFLRSAQRVRFEISLPAAERAGLRISSELLSVAERVRATRAAVEGSCHGAACEPIEASP